MKHFALLCRFCHHGFRSTKRWKRHENGERVKQRLMAVRVLLLEIPLLPATRAKP